MTVAVLRRLQGAALLLCMAAAAFAQERPTAPFDRNALIARAQALASQPHVSRVIEARSPLGKLSYDQYRAIEFQRGASIWGGEGRSYVVDLLHPGFIFNTPVDINLVVGGIARRVLYTTEVFKYGLDTGQMKNVAAPGYSGFRVATPINQEQILDEFLVFQGASYFRAVGRGNRYGLSARGLAVKTAKPTGEEFPVFTEFWIERPPLDATQIVIHALLESPSVTGAYTFTVAAGDPTRISVDSVLFPRTDLAAYGIAPLTSMFLFDATNRARFDDFRPAVHDSEGLSVVTANGEHVWRPLANPVDLQVAAFEAQSLVGFGLLQRHNDFRDFEDSEARYELRPSAWIEPVGDWGAGHVELVEIPSNEEIHDNIVAYWQPAEPMRAGRRYEYSYRMFWGGHEQNAGAFGRVVETSAGGIVRTKMRRFAVDFSADSYPDDLEVAVSVSTGAVIDARIVNLDATGMRRVSFVFDPDGADLAELRADLYSHGKRWGETWVYRWTR